MKHRYHVNLFWSEADKAWIADVPDLKPCSALGDTPAEALAEIEDAISGWLAAAEANGRPVPAARYRPAIYALPEAG
jgi:predicted RNase H-like HicB family nuclease